MKVTISLRGTLKKRFPDIKDKVVDIPEGSTCEDALESVGIYYKEIHNFGFVSVNSKRVMIYDKLQDGDFLKAYSKVYGG